MKLLVLIVSFLLMSCSNMNIKIDSMEKSMQHSTFNEYLKRFRIAHFRSTGTNINTKNLIIKLKVVDAKRHGKRTILYSGNVVGYCIISKRLPAVYIDIDAWNRFSDLLREALVFHELGHCLLRRPHCNVEFRGRPISIMRHHLILLKHYERFRDNYIDELFASPICRGKF